MKQLFILLAAISMSCSNDSESNKSDPADCNCNTILKANVFTLPNGYIWTVATLENDCSGVQTQKDIVGLHSVGEKICD